MQSQHIGVALRDRRDFAALTPQAPRPAVTPFIFSGFSPMVGFGYSQDTSPILMGTPKGQAGFSDSVVKQRKTRRTRCLRASRSSQRLALRPLSRPAHSKPKKNMLSWTQSPSQQSLCTQANTNNSPWGQPLVASDLRPKFASAHMQNGCVSHEKLDAAPTFAFYGPHRNKGGEEKCVTTSQHWQRSISLRHAQRRHQNPSRVSRATTSSATTNVTSFREQTPVSPMMTKNRASIQMGHRCHPAFHVSHHQLGMMTTTAAPLAAAQRPAQRRGAANTTLPSGSQMSEGTPC